jgi:hypothetical protein
MISWRRESRVPRAAAKAGCSLRIVDGNLPGNVTLSRRFMRTRRRFAAGIVAAIRDAKMLRIRAGTQPHRFIGVWAVVVEGRVFVRSWSLKPRSWYRTFLEEPRGAMEVTGRVIRVRAVGTRSERLKQAIDRAYLEKYSTRGSIKFARDLARARSRATTTELAPL